MIVSNRNIRRSLNDLKEGTEEELLNRARDSWSINDFRLLERFVEQGYAEQTLREMSPNDIANTYCNWCRTFNRRVAVLTVAVPNFYDHAEILLPKKMIDSLSLPQTQVDYIRSSFNANIWVEDSLRVHAYLTYSSCPAGIKKVLDTFGLPFVRGRTPYTEEASIERVQTILDLPFVRCLPSSPPAPTRYE